MPTIGSTPIKAAAQRRDLRKLLNAVVCTSIGEIGDAENISKSYVSRILRLALLAPDIIEAILAVTMDQGVILEQLEQPLPTVLETPCNYPAGAHRNRVKKHQPKLPLLGRPKAVLRSLWCPLGRK